MDEVILDYILPKPRIPDLMYALAALPIHPLDKKLALHDAAAVLGIKLAKEDYDAVMRTAP